jgi:hypothetical protein
MARPGKGLFDGIQGKFANAIGSTWKGTPVLRSKPLRKKNRKTSELQKAVQAKFKLASDFVGAIRDLINVSFQSRPGEIKENIAVSRIITKAIGGVYPDLIIDYSAIEVSKGSCKEAMNPVAVSTEPGMIRFSWMDNTMLGKSTPNDKAIMVAYCPDEGDALYTIGRATREDEEGTLNVRLFSGKQVHTWIAFLSAKDKSASDSRYTGMLTVAV